MVAKAYTKIRKMNRIISHTNEQIQSVCGELGLLFSTSIDIESLYAYVKNKYSRVQQKMS